MALQMPMKMMHKPNKWLTFERLDFFKWIRNIGKRKKTGLYQIVDS